MQIYDRSQVVGNRVELHTSSKDHIQGNGESVNTSKDPVESFSKVLFGFVNSVNESQLEADHLEHQMLIEPDSVDLHEVMIASEKARLSIGFFKSITEKAIKAYNDIMMIR